MVCLILNLFTECKATSDQISPQSKGKEEQGPRTLAMGIADRTIYVIEQVLDELPQHDTLPKRYQDAYDRLISNLREIWDKCELPSQ